MAWRVNADYCGILPCRNTDGRRAAQRQLAGPPADLHRAARRSTGGLTSRRSPVVRLFMNNRRHHQSCLRRRFPVENHSHEQTTKLRPDRPICNRRNQCRESFPIRRQLRLASCRGARNSPRQFPSDRLECTDQVPDTCHLVPLRIFRVTSSPRVASPSPSDSHNDTKCGFRVVDTRRRRQSIRTGSRSPGPASSEMPRATSARKTIATHRAAARLRKRMQSQARKLE